MRHTVPLLDIVYRVGNETLGGRARRRRRPRRSGEGPVGVRESSLENCRGSFTVCARVLAASAACVPGLFVVCARMVARSLLDSLARLLISRVGRRVLACLHPDRIPEFLSRTLKSESGHMSQEGPEAAAGARHAQLLATWQSNAAQDAISHMVGDAIDAISIRPRALEAIMAGAFSRSVVGSVVGSVVLAFLSLVPMALD